MKKMLFWGVLFALLCGCSEQGCPNYEPIYLNETEVDVSIMYGHIEEGFDYEDTLVIKSGDSSYCMSGEYFPLLSKDGLTGMNSKPYDVLVTFSVNPRKCLFFKGNNYYERDIRKFSSYKNIGECGFCVERGECVTEGMLYRITDDMLKEAKPCD